MDASLPPVMIMDPMKILLVDDSKSARYALRLQLQRHGAEVEIADSAESAFEVLKNQVPDAILMDHMMPGLNGFEALEVIRQNPRTAHVPVVMCTSHEDADFAATAKRKGVVGILPKSAAPEKLPAILAQLHDIVGSPGAAPTVAGAASPAPASRPASEVPSAGAVAAPALSEQDIARLIEERVESRINSLLSRTVEDLRHDLTENLSEDTRHLLDARLAEERASRDSAHTRDIESRLRAEVSRLVEETLPQLVGVEMEAERAQIRELMERYRNELETGVPSRSVDLKDRLADFEGTLSVKAREAARRESQQAVIAATERAQQVVDEARQSLSSGLTRVYLAILASTAIGVGAAAAVYALLS